jgi:hypothetical protein
MQLWNSGTGARLRKETTINLKSWQKRDPNGQSDGIIKKTKSILIFLPPYFCLIHHCHSQRPTFPNPNHSIQNLRSLGLPMFNCMAAGFPPAAYSSVSRASTALDFVSKPTRERNRICSTQWQVDGNRPHEQNPVNYLKFTISNSTLLFPCQILPSQLHQFALAAVL